MRSSTRRALCCFLLCRLCRTERRKNTTASSTMALQAHRIRFSVVGKGIMVIVGFLRVKKRAVKPP
ncbi:hypothetical protein GBFDFA_17670 (plasmid) [Edwardsiella anguillarum]|nr:hypothetical protein GBFDFA_17670 [Edwardsiella anguillarum]